MTVTAITKSEINKKNTNGITFLQNNMSTVQMVEKHVRFLDLPVYHSLDDSCDSIQTRRSWEITMEYPTRQSVKQQQLESPPCMPKRRISYEPNDKSSVESVSIRPSRRSWDPMETEYSAYQSIDSLRSPPAIPKRQCSDAAPFLCESWDHRSSSPSEPGTPPRKPERQESRRSIHYSVSFDEPRTEISSPPSCSRLRRKQANQSPLLNRRERRSPRNRLARNRKVAKSLTASSW
jgi:hypothetical protein